MEDNSLEVESLSSTPDALIIGSGVLPQELQRILANRNLKSVLIPSQQQVDPSASPEFIFWFPQGTTEHLSEFLMNFAKTIRSRMVLVGEDDLDLTEQLSSCIAADLDARAVLIQDLYGPGVVRSRLSMLWKNLSEGNIFLPDHDNLTICPLAIDDAAEALCLSAFSSQTYSRTIVVAGTTEMTILNFAYTLRDAALRHAGTELKLVHTREAISDEMGRLEKLTKRDEAYTLLSWKPDTDLAEGLKRFVVETMKETPSITKKKINPPPPPALTPGRGESAFPIQKTEESHLLIPSSQELLSSGQESQQAAPARISKFPNSEKAVHRRTRVPHLRVWAALAGVTAVVGGTVVSPLITRRIAEPLLGRIITVSRQGDVKSTTELTGRVTRLAQIDTTLAFFASPFWSLVNDGWAEEQSRFFRELVDRAHAELEMSKVIESSGKLTEILTGSSAEHPVVTMGQLESQSSTLLALLGTLSESQQGGGNLNSLRQTVSFARELIPLAKWTLGFDRKRTLLLVLQDASELRPTGGFITSIGFLTTEKGKLLDLTFSDIYDIDTSLSGKEDPPEPIRRLTGEDRWLARDGNWSPDGPTAAEHLERVVARATGREVDGSMFLTTYGLKRILAATGPVMSSQGEDISDQNIIERATFNQRLDTAPGNTEDVSSDAVRGLRGALSMHNSAQFLKGLLDALLHQELFVTAHDPEIALELSRLGIDGAVREAQCPTQFRVANCVADTIGVIDANLGINKVDYFLTRERSISVTVAPNKPTTTTLTLLYRNASTSTTRPAGIYHGYTRVLLPKDAVVTSVVQDEGGKNTDVMVDHDIQFGARVEGFYLHVPVNGEMVIRLSYMRPQRPLILEHDIGAYNLLLIKQPGVESVVTSVTVQFASSLVPTAVSPESYSSNNSLLFYLVGDKTTNVAAEFASML